MIVVVEGPSGAGKTTWCRTHGGVYALLEELPDHATVPPEPEAQARFWVDRNIAPWKQVLERERRVGLVVVDVDPFKLHFVWTLWRSGQVPQREWDLQRETSREAFSAGGYALADLYLTRVVASSGTSYCAIRSCAGIGRSTSSSPDASASDCPRQD